MTQPIIKIVLLAAIALVALFALRGSTKAYHRVVWRGYVVGILVVAGVSIVFPGALTWLAHQVGVGRGADLLLYVLVITFLLVSVILFRRLEQLDRKYVALARAIAVRQAVEEDEPGATLPGAAADPGQTGNTT